jgi:hypothetical protein
VIEDSGLEAFGSAMDALGAVSWTNRLNCLVEIPK